MARTSAPGLSLELVIGATPLVTLISSAVAAHSLGPTGRGLLSTITVWSQGVALLAFLSMDKGALAAGQGWPPEVPSGVLRASLRADVRWLTLLAGAVGAAVTRLLSGRWWVAATVGTATALLCCAEWSAGLAMVDDRWTAFKSWRVVQPAAFALAVVLTAVGGQALPQEQRTVAMAVGFVVSVAVGLALLRSPRRTVRDSPSAEVRRRVRRFASRYHLTTGTSLLASRMDLLLAPALLSFAQVGQYAVAAAGGAVLATVGSAALLRGLTQEPSASSRPPLVPLLAVIGTAGAGAALLPALLPLVFGQQFRPAVGPGQVLFVAGALGYLTQWQTGRMAARGLPAWAALPQVCTALVVLVAGLLTHDLLGLAVGVVLGRAVALAVGVTVVAVVRPGQAGQTSPAPLVAAAPTDADPSRRSTS